MKRLILVLSMFSSLAFGQESQNAVIEVSSDAPKSEKIKLLNNKVHKEVISKDHKVSFNIKLGYTHLTKSENDNEDLVNVDLEVRYAFADYWAVHAAMGKWFDVNGQQLSNSSGFLAHHMNVGLEYAVTGSFVRKNITTIHYQQKIYQKGSKFIVKNDRTESNSYNNYDGLRIFVNANQMELNNVEDSAYGWGGGAYYEWLKKSGNTFQIGAKYEQFNNSVVDANLGQLYISFGFLP